MSNDHAVSSRAIVKNAWASFASRDLTRVAEVFTEDAEWLAPAGNASSGAMGGVHHFVGRDAIARFITELFPQVFEDVDVEFRGFYGDGDVVVVEERMTATLNHGGHYDNEYCFVFELADGRVRRVREYMDTQRGAAWFEAPRPAPSS